MANRFTPVADPERARCEQDEESLRKHRQFDTPFALLPSNLNDKKRRAKEDLQPMGKRSCDLEKDEKGLWRQKAEVFDKKMTWGRETFEYVDPEKARSEGNTGPQWGRPGTVGWGTKGEFGGRGQDRGIQVLQRGEVDQAMVKNEKGLWVKRQSAADEENEKELQPASEGRWRCPKCGAETSKSLEFCRRCDMRRPASSIGSDRRGLRHASQGEDPRLEAAKKKGRGTEDAQKEALKALQERRKRETQVKERMGMMRRDSADIGVSRGPGQVATLNNSAKQVRPAPRARQHNKWQGVQTTDEDAQRVVSKSFGGSTIGQGAPIRLEPREASTAGGKASDESVWDDLADRIEADAASRSPSPEPKAGSEVVVDFF
eukprot:TRINITY_DN60725_c0_g1_i1.p1 TRINITY_DN60725_c0_g1~~TRINITY_DN60725_c0_g1_i1.p1  ORF type:complete len:391 (-),score=82.05 TRINITY_DN60725_c0_g1_i1:44-1165(-)